MSWCEECGTEKSDIWVSKVVNGERVMYCEACDKKTASDPLTKVTLNKALNALNQPQADALVAHVLEKAEVQEVLVKGIQQKLIERIPIVIKRLQAQGLLTPSRVRTIAVPRFGQVGHHSQTVQKKVTDSIDPELQDMLGDFE